jgi:hypothetical protein
MVAQIPYILCIYIELLAPVGVDGQVIVVALVKDEADGVIVYGNSIYNNVNL